MSLYRNSGFWLVRLGLFQPIGEHHIKAVFFRATEYSLDQEYYTILLANSNKTLDHR